MTIYTVKSGDSLTKIANSFGVTVSSIITINQMPDPNKLVVGEALIIPTPDRIHVVLAGDSLWKIAQQYGTTVSAITAANNISNPDQIYIGQRLIIPKPRPMIESNGYLTLMGASGAKIASNLSRYLTYICMFSYRITADGSVTTLDDQAIINTAKSFRTSPLMTLTNFSGRKFNSDLASTVLNSPTLQETVLNNCIIIMKAKGFTGLNIDFEYVYPSDKDAYNSFITRVVTKLRPLGYSISSALAPKNTENQPGLLYEAHDYAFHGKMLDFVILMTYEWGWAGGPPLAIAPINEVMKVLNYAVTVIPRNKIMMGMPTYGRDWKLPYVAGTSLAATVSLWEAVGIAYDHNVDIHYNTLYQSPFFNYTDVSGNPHEVWYEDARSVQAKFNIVKQYGLRGVSYWEISIPFQQNWPVLLDNFTIKKLL